MRWYEYIWQQCLSTFWRIVFSTMLTSNNHLHANMNQYLAVTATLCVCSGPKLAQCDVTRWKIYYACFWTSSHDNLEVSIFMISTHKVLLICDNIYLDNFWLLRNITKDELVAVLHCYIIRSCIVLLKISGMWLII